MESAEFSTSPRDQDGDCNEIRSKQAVGCTRRFKPGAHKGREGENRVIHDGSKHAWCGSRNRQESRQGSRQK